MHQDVGVANRISGDRREVLGCQVESRKTQVYGGRA